MGKPEDNLRESILSFHYLGFGDQIQTVRLVSKQVTYICLHTHTKLINE